jgi:hypothetical protein
MDALPRGVTGPIVSTTGMEHSPTSATGTAWERTPWRAVQRAAWEALRKPAEMAEPFDTRIAHPCFPQPRDVREKVWRYMSLSKLIALLQASALHLSRLDLLHDPHEGALPRAMVEDRRAFFEKEGIGHALPQLSALGQKVRSACYVNCWAHSGVESEAFWRLYANDDDGVAIQTTYSKLIDIIKGDDHLYLGHVTYIDYETQWFPVGNVLYPVMHKRLAFAHENEVRLVKLVGEHLTAASAGPLGLLIPVDLERLVDSVFITPYAPQWYADVAKAVVERFAPSLAGKVQWSLMKSAPQY